MRPLRFPPRPGLSTVAICLALLAMAGPAASGALGAGVTKITAGGRIGSLRLDHSRRAQIVAVAGEPEADETVEGGYPGGGWEGLGYRCSSSFASPPLVEAPGEGGVFCRTIYYLNLRSGMLGTFFTSEPNFVDGHGVSPGTRTAKAVAREGAQALVGCLQGIRLGTSVGSLDIAILGGHPHRRARNTVVRGGRVGALVLHSRRNDVGNFDCL
jgi:hypothetical protein